MQLSIERLEEQLKKGLKPFYLLYGEEPFARHETAHQILKLAQKKEFEIEKVEVDTHFDIKSLVQSSSEMSLFGTQKLYHIQIKQKLNKTLGEAFLKWFGTLSEKEDIVLFELNKLDKTEKNNPCIVFLEKNADVMACWPLTKAQLPSWLSHRAKSKGLTLGPEILERLSDCIEGNLLAGEQILTQIAMVTPSANTWKEIEGCVLDSARFDVYALSEACLMGQNQKALFIFQRLKQEGTEMTLILWTLSTLVKNLNKLYSASFPSEGILMQMGIWKRQQPLYRQMLARHEAKTILTWLKTCALLDDLIKHSQNETAAIEAERLILAMTGRSI